MQSRLFFHGWDFVLLTKSFYHVFGFFFTSYFLSFAVEMRTIWCKRSEIVHNKFLYLFYHICPFSLGKLIQSIYLTTNYKMKVKICLVFFFASFFPIFFFVPSSLDWRDKVCHSLPNSAHKSWSKKLCISIYTQPTFNTYEIPIWYVS